MPITTYREAAKQAILEEMRNDARVFVMGEDLHAGLYADALQEFGKERILNTPIAEAGFIGAGIGAALTGMRPIVEASVSTFLYAAMDQIVNQAAKSRYMFGGQASVPLVIRSTVFYKAAAAAHHSDRPWALFAQVPGLKIIVPTTPFDAKGLLKSAIRDGNPVLFFDDHTLLDSRGEVPSESYLIPIGKADIKRYGSDISVVAIAAAVHDCIRAAEQLEAYGISAEVIDIRSVAPMDREAILRSVMKTGRLLVVDAATRTCGLAAEICATVSEQAFSYLKGPIRRLTAPDVPVPFCPELECLLYPSTDKITSAVRDILKTDHSVSRRPS